ncbi:MAG: hypothetical protein KAH72_00010 [Flavobacteriaceae bacterium]|nr:hypothetical protein [Flavobacteriaceae bacterium]
MAKKEVLSRVLDILGIGEPQMGDFDSRLRLQKIVYLLQASGLSLGYGYNWYVRGPYSPDLTKTLYEIFENEWIGEQIKTIRFNDHDNIVSKLIDLRKNIGEENINDTLYLEVLASLHYINKMTFSGNGKREELKEKLFKAKPSLKNIRNIDIIFAKAYDNVAKFS